MVHTKLYCPEQISIPENFPNILKDYAKAALRTQPYDLLRWSATYFRCLQMGIPPPVKLRYEKNVEHGSVTKEYLRVLIKQVGKGFFISRLLLQQRWDGLCLPQDELFKYLSLCRMLHWPQIHWLKLFSILVGTISKTPLDTLITLCELLTDNVDGAEAYVPIWMFRVCYKFLAELDCSEEQTFIDGRKLLQNGELEDEIHIKATPEICSPLYLRNAVLEECRNRYTEAKSNENNVENYSKMNEENNSTENQLTDRKSIASSENFEFSRINGWDRKRIIDSYADFDSIILLLREAQGAKLHEYDGPAKITQKHIRHAKCRQNEIMEERERQANMYEEAGKHEIYAQQIKMIKNLGPPWTWLHEFVSDHHCIDKSYNFIDVQSIISDATPIISSDESFDFDKEKPIVDATSESEDEMTVISKQTSKNDDNGDVDESFDFEMKANDKEQNEIEKLLEENTERIRRIESEEQEEYGNLGPCLRHLRSTLTEIGIGEGHIPETESVVSFLRKEAAEVLERAGEKYNPQVDLLEIAKILEQAHQKGVNFSNLDEMIDYIRKVYPEQKNIIEVPEPCETEQRNVDLTNVTKEVVEEECIKVDVRKTGEIDPNPEKIEEENENLKNVDDQTKGVKEENEEDQISNIDVDTLQKLDDILSDNRSEDEIKDIRIQVNIKVDNDSEHESQDDSKDKDKAEKQELEKLEDKFLEKNSVDNIRDAFVADGIDADEHLINEQISRELILGLIPKTDTPTVEEVVDEENEVEESVITATSSEISMLGNINDDSSLQPSTERSADTAIEREMSKKVSADIKVGRQKENTSVRPNAFQCKIPPIPGIGKTVKQETIRNFLTFLKGKSQLQNGMICPRNFKDPNCPDIVDCDD